MSTATLRHLAIAVCLAACNDATPRARPDVALVDLLGRKSDGGIYRTLQAETPNPTQLRMRPDGTVEVNGKPATDPRAIFEAAWELGQDWNQYLDECRAELRRAQSDAGVHCVAELETP